MKSKINSCGIDEVGRGALAGPLVVACVSFYNYDKIPLGIRDSKTISFNLRSILYKEIIKSAFIGISIISSVTIDKVGINKATEKGALDSFKKIKRNLNYIFLDGNIKPDINTKYANIPKGDSNFVSIAAASIVAKCIRDKIMFDLSKVINNYGWVKNVGYGTKEHLLAIKKYGITKYHRRCYEPVKSMVKINELR